MNNARRKVISENLDKLRNILGELENARDEEQAYRENMPEAIQAGAKGDAAQEAEDALTEAVDEISNAISGLEGIQ